MSTQPISLGQKIQERRHLLGITQEALARQAGVSYTTLTKIESGAIQNPSIKMMTKIAQALGISIDDLTDRTETVQTFSGKNGISRVLDDVYNTLKTTGGEVCISGIDERKFLKIDQTAITNHLARLSKAGIKEKLLSKEGDAFFFSGEQSEYRWLPENLFNPAPFYMYGDKLAFIIWGPPEQVIIIKNAALADAYHKQFMFMWDKAALPPARKSSEDERVRLEKAILKRYGGRITSITDNDRQLFRKLLSQEKISSYGNSYYYLCQAANGIGSESLGLKYYDGKMLIAIGIFSRTSFDGGWHYFLNHPIGAFNQEKTIEIARAMLELSGHPVFIKKITTEQRDILLARGFSSIEDYPWHSQALEEDDTFPEQIIDVEHILAEIERPGKRNLKNQYLYFKNKTKNARVEFKNLEIQNQHDAKLLVNKFFNYLDIKNLHISRVSDYDNIIAHPPLGKNGRRYFTQILYIDETPAAFFAMEPIAKNTLGLFANISLHQQYHCLSEYLIIECCRIAKQNGYEYINLGGSETTGLYQFKEKFAPVKRNKMHWVVYRYAT